MGEGRLLNTGRGPFAFSGTNGGSVKLPSSGATEGGLLIVFAGSARRSGSTQDACQHVTNDPDVTSYQSKT